MTDMPEHIIPIVGHSKLHEGQRRSSGKQLDARSESTGFNHSYLHLFYYAALAAMALLLTSFWLNMAWVTLTALVYVVISLTVGDGIDIEAGNEKVLLARIAIMYVVVAAVNLATEFEQIRWRQAVEREQALQRERVELSYAIHDTTAQSAYIVGLGIDAAQLGDRLVAAGELVPLPLRLRCVPLRARHPGCAREGRCGGRGRPFPPTPPRAGPARGERPFRSATGLAEA